MVVCIVMFNPSTAYEMRISAWSSDVCSSELLDPVFSSGVGIAMKSADLATGVLGRQLRDESVDWDREFSEPLKIGVATFRGFVESWYDGSLSAIFFHPRKHEKIQRMI